MSAIQDYLRDGGSLGSLTSNYAISITRHPIYNNLCLFKYDQIASPPTHPLVLNARGLILDENDNWRIICRRFNRFFNYGDVAAAQVNFDTAKALVKADGSIITLYHAYGKWHCSTSGHPSAAGSVGEANFSFADLFWQTWNKTGLKLPENTNLCPSFELMTPWNIVVVPHNDAQIVFIGLHNRATDEELRLDTIPEYPAIESHEFKSFDDLILTAQQLNGFEQEGYVLTDFGNKLNGDFCRNKMKGKDYIAKHHLKSGWSTRKALEIVLINEVDETSLYFPAFADQLKSIKVKYENLIDELTNIYESLKHIQNQKEFAIALENRKCRLSGALYSLRAGKVKSIREFISKINVRSLVDILELKEMNYANLDIGA